METRPPEPLAAEGLLEHLEHRLFKKPLWAYLRGVHPLVILTSPIIYLCAIPFFALDLAVTVYQAICFPVYRIAKVRRRDYLVFDRGRLAYLNAIEKIGCVYCSYANGLLAYIVEIAARTEQHFCPIKHVRPLLRPHSLYQTFVPYGDPRAYRKLVDHITPAPATPKSA